MKQRPTEFADARPRIHVWPQEYGCAWSIGPVGLRKPSTSIGCAVDSALERVGRVPAVIIVEASCG